ncbi:MAG: signal peptidase I [Planctomycetes bacterium]|nr:signal peptidase I [Planctomycetota bacterium]
MARSLNGAHGTHVCDNCGWESDFGPSHSARGQGTQFVWPRFITCPNCQERTDQPEQACPPPKPGDRVLVHKWPFDIGGWLGPKRWDVIVFRDPSDPKVNYIKRLVGLPGETVEIINGDLFIRRRGQDRAAIAQKTPAAQSALWFLVYDHNYLAERPARYGVRAKWVADGGNETSTGWQNLSTKRMRCTPVGDKTQIIRFAPEGPHSYLQDLYAYNRGSSGATIGDVKLTGEITPRAGTGWLEFRIRRGDFLFTGRVQRDGTATLTITSQDNPRETRIVASKKLSPLRDDWPIAIEMAHVDYRVYLSINGSEVVATSEENYAPDLDALREETADLPPVELSIAANQLALDLRGLRIDRDVYYTHRPGITLRASAGDGFSLDVNEYFVLGDNSPASHDSREWFRSGLHMPADYRTGTVRADKIVGLAFFVYLPGPMPLDQRGRLQVVDIGRTRFVR